MFTYTDWLVHMDHYKELLREAENERLVRQAMSAQNDRKVEKKARVRPNTQAKPLGAPCCP